MAVLVAIAVNKDGYLEFLGAAEGIKEDEASWISFFQWRKGRGLESVKFIVGGKRLGMLEAAGEVFPEAKYQRCIVRFPAEVGYVCFCSRGVPINGMVAPTPEKTAHLSSLFSPLDCCFIVNDIGCRSGHDMPAHITFPERR